MNDNQERMAKAMTQPTDTADVVTYADFVLADRFTLVRKMQTVVETSKKVMRTVERWRLLLWTGKSAVVVGRWEDKSEAELVAAVVESTLKNALKTGYRRGYLAAKGG